MNSGDENKLTNGHHAGSADSPATNVYGLATRAIHGGGSSHDYTHNPVRPPLYFTTTYETRDPGKANYEYSRGDNPTRTDVQKKLASIENAKHALVFGSGLGALTTATFLLESGQHVVCCDDVYGGTHRFFSQCANRMGIQTAFVDGINIEDWTNNFQVGKTKMVWIETPTNPTMKILDVKKVVQSLKVLDPNCMVVVDNTFMTPVHMRPLELGADIVMYSCTKYINGHSDVIMGALITNNSDIYKRLKFNQNALGIVPSPMDCWLTLRSMDTLEIRVLRQSETAMQIARFLEKSPYVERVLYPGLESHPQHELAKNQCTGFSGIMSIWVKDITGKESSKILEAVRVFHAAVSLGCVSSLIQIPSLMTHTAVPEAHRLKLGMTDNLLRLSIGLEDAEDLIADLDQALKFAYSKTTNGNHHKTTE